MVHQSHKNKRNRVPLNEAVNNQSCFRSKNAEAVKYLLR